jgi:hypothetical protein
MSRHVLTEQIETILRNRTYHRHAYSEDVFEELLDDIDSLFADNRVEFHVMVQEPGDVFPYPHGSTLTWKKQAENRAEWLRSNKPDREVWIETREISPWRRIDD